MAEIILIPKATVQIGGASAPVKPAWFKDDGNVVWLVCACGDLLTIDTHGGTHQIAQDGGVTPSLFDSRPVRGCGFHVFGKLDGWEG